MYECIFGAYFFVFALCDESCYTVYKLKVQPLQIKKAGENMAYISSKNLIDEPDLVQYTHVGFKLKCNKNAGVPKSLYCCPYCKQIYKKNPFIKKNSVSNNFVYQCKYCNTELNLEMVDGYNDYWDIVKNGETFSYKFRSVQTVLLGRQYSDDDNHLVAVNQTVFFREHTVFIELDLDTNKYIQKYRSYVSQSRVIFNLDQNQIYYVTKPAIYGRKQFEHFLLKDVVFDSKNMLENVLNRKIIEIIYKEAYHFNLTSPVQALSSITTGMAFYLMKFPVVSSYAFWKSVKHVTPDLFALFYWLSNSDRKLRALITCRDFNEYDMSWTKYLEDVFDVSNSEAVTMIHQKSPWFLLTAWQMGHMGFRSLDSLYRIEHELLMNELELSMFVYLLFEKRFHAINKFFKRLINYWGEDTLIHMIVSSPKTESYNYYSFHYRQRLIECIKEIDFNTEDFSKPLDDFFTDCFILMI